MRCICSPTSYMSRASLSFRATIELATLKAYVANVCAGVGICAEQPGDGLKIWTSRRRGRMKSEGHSVKQIARFLGGQAGRPIDTFPRLMWPKGD